MKKPPDDVSKKCRGEIIGEKSYELRGSISPGIGSYVGGLKNGKFHGQGTFIYIDKTIQKGEWNDGKSI